LSGVGNQQKNLAGLTRETFLALRQTCKALADCAEWLIDQCGFDVVLLGLLQSDPVSTGFIGFISENTAFNGLSVQPVTPCSGVYTTSPVLLWAHQPGCVFFLLRRARSLLSSFIAFLLLTVESNPGPSAVRFGAINAGSAVHKGALIDELICDNRLDILAVCESWIKDDDPDVIKTDIAPTNYTILHVSTFICPDEHDRSRRGSRQRRSNYNSSVSRRTGSSSRSPACTVLQTVLRRHSSTNSQIY
jgi:hypothetical protein